MSDANFWASRQLDAGHGAAAGSHAGHTVASGADAGHTAAAGSDADFWVGPTADPDRYRLVSLLGGGGEGEVWEAVLPLSAGGRSTVAVKIVAARPGDEQEFEQFGRLLRMLSHPGLVRVIDVFTGPSMHRGQAADPASRSNYIVMDYVKGSTLREWCDENPDAPASARLKMLRTVASALDEMHSGLSTQVPVAHGDVKPSNVVVRDGGGTVLVDLGLTRLVDTSGASGRSAPYAAPELRGPHPSPSPEADRYAFAVTAAQVLTGAPVPTGVDGWLDPATLTELLNRSSATARRPMLVRHVLTAIAAAPAERPRLLRVWLDSASETLSQVTTSGSPIVALKGAPASGPASTLLMEPPTQVVNNGWGTVPAKSAKRGRGRWIVGLAALAVVAALAGVVLLNKRPETVEPVPSPAAALPSAAPSLTTTEPPVETSSEASSSAGLPTQSKFITAQDRVDYSRDSGVADSGSDDVGGHRFGHTLRMRAQCGSDNGGDYWLEYNLSREWSRFSATVGLSDTSTATSNATYTLLGDGKPLSSGKVVLGQATKVDVPVQGILRLRLQVNQPESTEYRRCAGPGVAWVVWGDPTLAP